MTIELWLTWQHSSFNNIAASPLLCRCFNSLSGLSFALDWQTLKSLLEWEFEIVSLIYQVLVILNLIHKHLSKLFILGKFCMNRLYILLQACDARFVVFSLFFMITFHCFDKLGTIHSFSTLINLIGYVEVRDELSERRIIHFIRNGGFDLYLRIASLVWGPEKSHSSVFVKRVGPWWYQFFLI